MGAFALERPSCPICDILFETTKMLKAHKRNAHTRCSFCKKRFFGQKELESHQRQVGHGYCKECNLCFSASSIQLQHVRTVEHTDVYQCYDCERQYHGQIYLNNHCCDCDRVFKGSQGLQSHLASHKLHHPRNNEPRVDRQQVGSQNLICGTKKNTTINPRNKSNRRRPIYCHVSAQCKKRFAKLSALISHLESGSCASGWTRNKLNTMISVHDQDRLVSAVYVDKPLVTLSSTQSPQLPPQEHLLDTNLIPSGNLVGDGTDADEWLLVERSASRSIMKADNDSQSEWSIVNSEWSLPACTASVALEPYLLFSGLQCTLCPLSKPCFPTLKAWRTHTMSAAHVPKIFRCPTALLPEVTSGIARKQKSFSALSGLLQHLESGACHGKGTLRLVFKYVEEQLNLPGPFGVDLLT